MIHKKQKILLTWIAAIAFVLLNLTFNQTSSRNAGILFILFIAGVTTVDTLKKAEADPDAPDSTHINTRILKEKFGKYYVVRTFWSLGLMLVGLALRVLFPDVLLSSRIMLAAVVIFMIHGLYLCGIIISTKAFRRRF